MPGQRAANNSVKRAAKRLEHNAADDLRRAYERLGRIEILEGALAGSPFVDVTALTNLAQQQLAAGESRNAAGLLRAAEHVCFAALAPKDDADAPVSSDLKRAIKVEFEGLMRRAEERWQAEEEQTNRRVIEEFFSRALSHARAAFTVGAFHPALEFARAAEALADVRGGLPATLPERGFIDRLAS